MEIDKRIILYENSKLQANFIIYPWQHFVVWFEKDVA
jgi:hypothetical protein